VVADTKAVVKAAEIPAPSSNGDSSTMLEGTALTICKAHFHNQEMCTDEN
jgi:hypothetical protein